MRKTSTESHHTDVRWVAELDLPTGTTRTIASDWKPSHWDNDNRAIADSARSEVRSLERDYGITGIEVRVYRETRATTRQVIVETGRTLHSTIPAVTP